jgi:hypothetical protein
VVINQIDIGDVLILNPRVALAMDDRFLARGEDHAPVAGDRHRLLASAVAAQGMQPQARQRHVGWHRSGRQRRQHRA